MSSSDALTSAGKADRDGPPVVAWRPWTRKAFDEAARGRKPVLLSITAPWCQGCAVMDRNCYEQPGIAATIQRRFVPVRVDADRRPDIHDRYNLEGLPTTAFLTPSGEVLTGSTYLPPERLASELLAVADAYTERGASLEERASAAAAARRAGARDPQAAPPDLSAPEWFSQQIVKECDRQHGGFGAGGRFLHADVLRVALLVLARTPHEDLRDALARTLDGMAEGAIHDRADGGFFRYARGRDWSGPHTEKLLHDQAGLVSVYLEAAQLLSRPAWNDVARRTVAFVSQTLRDPIRGGFRASRGGDEQYYAASPEARRTMTAPPIDGTVFVDANATAAGAWWTAARALQEPSLAEDARSALHRIMSAYRPGQGVPHWVDDPEAVRGLLSDQVHTAAALLDQHEAGGDIQAVEAAEDLMRTALRTMWDRDGGGFLDRQATPDDVGLLADPLKPLALNCLAARVLARLSVLTGDPDLQQRAVATVESQTPSYSRHGIAGAPYVEAVLELFG